MQERAITVVLVDDHIMFREGLRSLLEASGEIRVVGEASEPEHALNLLRNQACDVVLMDISLGDVDGVQTTKRVKEAVPEVAVLVLSMHGGDAVVLDALHAGADGYLIKSASADELLRAVREVRAGRTYLHPKVAGAVLQELRKKREAPTVVGIQLSEREREILDLLGQGLSNKEIGCKLFLTENTIKTHMRSLFRKLNVNDRTQAVLHALREGLLVAPDRGSDKNTVRRYT